MNTPSRLYLVPTPIGNLEDITLRALRILKEVDFILTEDTRKSSILLKHYGISKPLVSHHQHNEHQALSKVIARLAAGETAALISDAGTPGISDPGFLLVRGCVEAGIPVETLPGASALIPAVVTSGLPCDTFYFAGFLPHKKGRQRRLQELARIPATIIIYESPYRTAKLLSQLMALFGPERRASVARELTKIHEEHIRGTLEELAAQFDDREIKGEVVIVVEGTHDATG